ncbi:MAG TPA: anti-sigma factor [Porphyromonadaceae bacterium]|nr:anti-sigma factor [Porphyromonadaceae bacterium]
MENYFKRILELFAKNDVSPDARAAFQRWIIDEKHAVEKDLALNNLWNQLEEGSRTEVTPQMRRSLKLVYLKIRERQGNSQTRILRFWQVAAAILLVALVTTLYFTTAETPVKDDLIEQYVPIAGVTHLTLPDGTEVQMNATTTLLYPQQFTGETRSVYLIGEASFRVAHNEAMPFIVKSNDYQVTALGTAFNMRVYPGDPLLSTTLLSGSVEVRYNNLESARILQPSEQFTYNKNTGEESITRPDLFDVTAWQRGELIFKSATLEEIIAELERKYPVTFVYTANTLKADRYTFRFKSDTPLQLVMEIITEVSGHIRYRIEEDKCYILPLQSQHQ